MRKNIDVYKRQPYKEVNIGLRFPVDLLSFLHDTPGIDTIDVYKRQIRCNPFSDGR